MGIVHGNWLTGTHSGRACKHENVYTRVNRKTVKSLAATKRYKRYKRYTF